jgi:hypothetical protein
MHPACSCVASRGVFTLLCMLYSNNLKALCIPHGEGRTKFLRKKYGKRPYKYKEKNNAAIILRNLILCIDGYVYHIPGSVTFVDSRYMKLILMLFQICVFIEIVKLFEYKFFFQLFRIIVFT